MYFHYFKNTTFYSSHSHYGAFQILSSNYQLLKLTKLSKFSKILKLQALKTAKKMLAC